MWALQFVRHVSPTICETCESYYLRDMWALLFVRHVSPTICETCRSYYL